MSKDSGSSKSVQTAQPWGPLVQPLTNLVGLAGQWYQGSAPQYYPGNTVAPLTPEQTAGLQGIVTRATNGSPVDTAAQTFATKTLNGDFLDPSTNPALQGVFNNIASKVIPAVNAQFENAGRSGSPLQGLNLASQLTQSYSPFVFDTYNQARQQQAQVAALSPSISGVDYTNLSQLLGAGNTLQGQAQNELNSNIDRFNFGQNLPYNKLAQYLGLLTGAGAQGGTTTTSTPTYTNTAANVLGGASTGAGLASLFSSNPWVGGGAAALGGLLGLFS